MHAAEQRYNDFAAFYPYYLSEHRNHTCRRLHFVGTSLVLLTALYALLSGHLAALALLPVGGYGCAWIGHFFFEKNRPATFKYPLYSLLGDFVMYKDLCLGRIVW